MNSNVTNFGGLHRSASNYWEEGDPHDLHEVLTYQETMLRSMVDEQFFRSIREFKNDSVLMAAHELFLEDKNFEEYTDTCIRFMVHTIAKKQYYTQYDLLSRAHNHYYCDVLIPLLHDETMQNAWEEYQEHFQKYVEACKEAMIKDLRARAKIV